MTQPYSSQDKMLHLLSVLFFFQILLTRSELINDPTLKPNKTFSASADGDAITCGNSKQNTKIIFHRTYDERKKIEEYYNKKNNPICLLATLQSTNEGCLNTLFFMALKTPERILADTVYQSITSGKGPVGDIEEVVCANDGQMKDRIDKYYQSSYQKTVANHLATFRAFDKPYQDVMQKYCWKGLCQDKKITPEDADKEAQALRGIGAKKHKTDFKNKFIALLDKYCEPDMKLIFQKYRHGDNGIEEAVSDAFTDDREWRAYFHLVRYIEDPCTYYAFELRHAADDSDNVQYDKINRIIMTRSERDLFCIAKVYSSQDGYKTFTSRLSAKMGYSPLYLESLRYLLGKP